ncbi:MAG: kynureninase [Gammaproteobacteria bacterium]
MALDAHDPLAGLRGRFAAPGADTIFLDANSMGAMPATVPGRLAQFCTHAWTEMRRQGWTHFEWLERPHQIGAAIAPFIGARPQDVIACDSTTVNLFKMLGYAWRVRESGHIVLTESGNFPTDLYVAQGMTGFVEGNPQIKVCSSRDEVLDSITDDVAVVYLSHVDYRSAERWDMARVNRLAHAAGALTVWDLSHAAGAVPVDLQGSNADLAVGCGYKYLSLGPGGPAYLWVNPRHGSRAWPAICGWMGHENVFAFAKDYAPLAGASGHATGTPPVLANEVAWCAAEIWREVEPRQLWNKHRSLAELLVALLEQQCASLGVELISPRNHDERGGHVSFRHPGAGPVCEALLEAGVIGSFRNPDSLRFGLGALSSSHEDIWNAVARLKDILVSERWREHRFQNVSV